MSTDGAASREHRPGSVLHLPVGGISHLDDPAAQQVTDGDGLALTVRAITSLDQITSTNSFGAIRSDH
jgi:hypothetical protein